MVRVVNKKEILKTTCPNCKAEIEYEEDDVVGLNTCNGIVCPVCGEEIEIEIDYPEPTFPKAFYQFGVHNGSVKISDKETQDYIDKVYLALLKTPEKFDYHFTGSGDTMVYGFKDEDGITINVAKNYYEWYKCFEE